MIKESIKMAIDSGLKNPLFIVTKQSIDISFYPDIERNIVNKYIQNDVFLITDKPELYENDIL